METIQKLEAANAKSIEPTQSAELEWANLLAAMVEPTLLKYAGSWWTGANIPGKKVQIFNYAGGLDSYEKRCREAISTLKGFDIVLNSGTQPRETHSQTTTRRQEADLVTPVSA